MADDDDTFDPTDAIDPTETSRRKLVRAGVELVQEHFVSGTGLREIYAYLTPRAVADRAGVSRGLIYHHWGDPAPGADGPAAFDAFLSAVADDIWSLSAAPENLADLAQLLPDNQSDLIRELTAYELERVTQLEGPLWRASEVLLLHGARPEVDAETVIRRLADFYRVAFAQLGRTPRPPLDVEDIAVAVSCVFGGFATQALATPERIERHYDWAPEVEPELPGEGWSLLAITIEGLIRSMTCVDPLHDQATTERTGGP